MEDIIKKFVYTSVGMAAQATTRIRDLMDELIRDRKISEEEGKRIVDDFTTKTKSQTKELEEQFRSFTSIISRDYEPSPESEIKRLKKKIRMLEDKLVQANNRPDENLQEDAFRTEKSNPLQGKKELFFQKLQEQSGSVDKVVNNERVSLGDDVLTPEKKWRQRKEECKFRAIVLRPTGTSRTPKKPIFRGRY